MLSEEYDDLWINLIYGSSEGNQVIVDIALTGEGYVYGYKFRKWYGFDSRVEWCAVFVGWIANEAGVLNVAIPKFAGVGTRIDWFKMRDQCEKQDILLKLDI